MDWLLATPTMNSAFSSLGSIEGDTYVVNPNALAILEEINFKLTYEDQTLRTFRRAIGFGQNVRTDLIPLLENAKDDDVFDSVVRILVNLTVPVECLFSVDVMYRTEVGRHTIFELNKLLYSSKEAFTDAKSTKCVVEFMKHILESGSKLSPEKCDQINNCLVLLRNILHVPETNSSFIVPQMHASTGPVSMQNSILWNLFIQSIDKLLLNMMSCPQRAFWGVTMVQLIALIYKDQHVSTLQKLLNMWFEASLSESSEDNESNTSPPKQGSGDSSPMLMSDPTSDSSDNGGIFKNESSEDRRQALREETEATLQEVSRKGHEYQNAILRVPTKQPQQPIENETLTEIQQQPAPAKPNTSNDVKDGTSEPEFMLPLPPHSTNPAVTVTGDSTSKDNEISHFSQKFPHSGNIQLTKGKCCAQKRECPSSQSELSDCGYATQVENQESISTSSNDDDAPQNKPVHQKPPCNSKPRNKPPRAIITLLDKKELRRKKLVKRSKSSLINMKGLVQHIPTDEDISNLLKEFTVDFLLKGYDYLVDDLHTQLLTNLKLTIDTSHFFWLVTYFLKFAAQLELDLEHIHSILTFDMISYLTYEGVMLCEQLELNSRQEGSDLKPYLRRMHLLVTAIREFLQAIETYKKVTHLCEEDREYLQQLQVQISSSEDIRCLFVLLIRRFNPNVHTKQYLQDLVVTNHMLLLILDNVTKSDTSANIRMIDHITQFATPEIMNCYGILLENFNNNGEFINDCIFTMMHHIGGDLGQIGTLFQPVILKTFSRIWEADYELCDDWSDLIEYVISKFMNTPQKSPFILETTSLTELTKEHNLENTNCSWPQEDMNTLYWYYVQSKKTRDVVGTITHLFSRNGNKQKSRISIIQQLLQQDIITLVEYDDLMKFEDAEYQRSILISTSSSKESGIEINDPPEVKPSDDFQILCDLIIKENKGKLLTWLQKVLLECCYVKLTLKKTKLRKDLQELPHIMEPVAYHCIVKNKSFPVVQWNTNQASTMHYQPFVLLLHKLGFQLPADAGSVFAHIPAFWTADMMFFMAKKLGSLDNLVIKFDVSLLKPSPATEDEPKGSSLSVIHEVGSESVTSNSTQIFGEENVMKSSEKDSTSEMFAMPKAKHCNSIIRFTPDPETTPSVPNWLQLVMRSKCAPIDKYYTDLTMPSNVIVSSLISASHMTPFNSSLPLTLVEEQHSQEQEEQQDIKQQLTALSDDDSAMKSLAGNERKDSTSTSSGFYTQSRSGSGNLDSEYSAMVASVYEHEIDDSNTASVTSDLTRMNVSDDDEKPESINPDALE